jgi:hypothetical protein
MKKVVSTVGIFAMGTMLFLASTAANATNNLALGKIQAIKILDRSGSEYIQVLFPTSEVMGGATGCEETVNGGTTSVIAYISYASHTPAVINMWLSALMSAYETGAIVRVTSAGVSDPCEVDMVALEPSNL